MLACAFVAEFVDAQVVKTLGFLGVVVRVPPRGPFCAFVLWLSRFARSCCG